MDKRSTLGNNLLDDLLVLNTDLVHLKDFNPDRSISLWWNDKVSRPNQRPRKEYTAHSGQTGHVQEEEDSEPTEMLLEWEEWLDD